MKKLIILILFYTGNALGLSLGDMVTNTTAKAETTTTSIMTLSAQKSDHTEYTINKASGVTTILVNKQGSIYGFNWNDKSPDLNTMLGTYKPEFDTAYAKRNKGDHRRLIIDTPNLSVQQFGLPGSSMQGSMVAKDLQP